MDSQTFPPYSVLMSLYAKERAEYLREALNSMLAQTVLHDPNSPLRNDEFYIPVAR